MLEVDDLRALAAAVAEVLDLRERLAALEARLAPILALWVADPQDGTSGTKPQNGADPPVQPDLNDMLRTPSVSERICERAECGEAFTPTGRRQKFCSRRCSQLAWAAARKPARKAPGRARKGPGTTTPPEAEAPAGEPPGRQRQASPSGPLAAVELPSSDDNPFSESRWHVDDPKSDPLALRPPALPWEERA